MNKKTTVLITLGPTREYIDPVRFITNASSGKMGYELAKTIYNDNVKVTVICGTVNISLPEGIKKIIVQTSQEMYKQVKKYILTSDIFISCAAITDFKPFTVSKYKIKKKIHPIFLKLLPTIDILSEIDKYLKIKNIRQKKILIGFALETNNIIYNAKRKIKEKGLDIIIANLAEYIGEDYNEITIINKNLNIKKLKKLKKETLAKKLWPMIKKECSQKLFSQ